MKKFLIIAAITTGLIGWPFPAKAAMLLFNDPGDLGVVLSGHMDWNGTGGGHLYMEQYYDDDFIFFGAPTFVNSFQMNAMPWEGYAGGDAGTVDVAAFDSGDNRVWDATVDLRAARQWDQWITVPVQTPDIASMAFYSPFNTHGNGFWPSIDNMAVNETPDAPSINVIPEPMSLWLLTAGLIGLRPRGPRGKRK